MQPAVLVELGFEARGPAGRGRVVRRVADRAGCAGCPTAAGLRPSHGLSGCLSQTSRCFGKACISLVGTVLGRQSFASSPHRIFPRNDLRNMLPSMARAASAIRDNGKATFLEGAESRAQGIDPCP